MSITKLYTADDLMAMGLDAEYELIAGDLRDMPPSAFDASEIGAHILAALHPFVYGKRLGRLSSEAGGYILSRNPDTVVAPDVGFVRWDSAPEGIPPGRFAPMPPDLAVEVMSPSNSFADVQRKVQRYLAAGTRLIWVVRPERQAVIVYAPDREPMELGIADELDGEDIVPGFRLPISQIFR
jgi:Uma2 family endonuclease